MKTLLLSLSVLMIGTTLNAQDAPNQKNLDQKQTAQKILELQRQIEKLVQQQSQLKAGGHKHQSIQRTQQRKTVTGPDGTKSFSSGVIKIIGPDGKIQTFNFDPEQPGELKAQSLLLGHVPDKPEFMIGIAMTKIPEGFHELIGIEPGEGVIINTVMKGTPADKAGLQKKDLILKLNDKKVTSPEQVQETIKLARGNKMTMSIRRGKESLEVALTPEKTKQPKPGTPTRLLFNGLTIDGGDLEGLELGVDVSKIILDHNFVGPGVITKTGKSKKEIEAIQQLAKVRSQLQADLMKAASAKSKEVEALKQQVNELAKQQAEMKALLESVKELIAEQKN